MHISAYIWLALLILFVVAEGASVSLVSIWFAAGALAAVMDLILGYPQDRTALIGFFMVDASRQGTGLGSRLVTEAMECLRAQGFTRLRLGVDKGNPQSLAFWKKNGFMQVSEDRYIVMERDI